MGKKFSWKTLSFESTPDAQFSSYVAAPDGTPISTVDQAIKYMFNGHGVTRDQALSLGAVARGRDQICEIATWPLLTYDSKSNVRDNSLLSQIDPSGLPNLHTVTRTLDDLIFDGKAYWIVDQFSSKGYPVSAHHVPVGSVTEQDGEFWVEGVHVDRARVIDFLSPKQALLKAMASLVKRALHINQTSEMYARNPMPKLLFSPKADVDPEPEATSAAIQTFANTAADSPYSYVGAALDAKPIELLSPMELQLIDSMKEVKLEIANFLGLEPEEVGVAVQSDSYSNSDARRRNKLDRIAPFMQAIEQRLSVYPTTPQNFYVKFSLDEYFRADPKTRAEVAEIEVRMGATTPDEYRATKGLPPLTPEQRAEIRSMQQPAPGPTAVEAAQKPALTFDAEGDVNLYVEGAQFSRESVNTSSRTVVGLAVPYGQAARSGGRKWEFQKGSLKWTDLKRIKLLRDHDNTQAVGYAIDAEDTDKGLVVTFKVAPGPAGDAALADFLAGTHDGLSIGVNFEETDYFTDPAKPGTNIVRNAQLREVSQTAMPAFDDSRSITVTASREGVAMTDNTNAGAVNETASEKTYTVAEFQAMQNMFGKPAPAASIQDDVNVAPAPKANAQEKKVEFVSEPLPYRFDGNDKNEFSGDVIAILKGDADSGAVKRVEAWKSATFAVATSNVTEANVTQNKPELYVDERNYRYPIWNTLYKGRPDNGVQPFTVPKYNSDTGLVANHTEGTEPSLGTFDMTNQTVTPTAVSGKIEINREAWDMGGSPNVSRIIRDLMTKRYFEALEAYAATYLDGLTLTGLETTITTAGTDAQVVDQFETAIADLSVARGGESLSDLLLHITLHKKLMLAKDSTGRRLIPRIGATNANGTAGSRLASLDLDGFVGRPAWAFSAGVSTDDGLSHNSYLLDPSAVWAWATQPEFMVFDIQVKSVYLGLWGYKAIAALDINGIRRIKYDTTT